MDLNAPLLIVGLGNPGKEYDLTRHNMGAMVATSLAERLSAPFKREGKLFAKVATSTVDEMKVLIALPTTYMNLSGKAVRRLADYFKVPTGHILILSDDVHIDYGTLRLREKGSSGGQKGLKSIEEHLSTQQFARLKIGISDALFGDRADYVLGRLTNEEQQQLPTIIDESIKLIHTWCGSRQGDNDESRTPTL